MKIICILIALVAFPFITTAQQVNWAFKISSMEGDEGMAITSDKFGDIITTGYFGGAADFDPSTEGINNLSPWNNSINDIYLLNMMRMVHINGH